VVAVASLSWASEPIRDLSAERVLDPELAGARSGAVCDCDHPASKSFISARRPGAPVASYPISELATRELALAGLFAWKRRDALADPAGRRQREIRAKLVSGITLRCWESSRAWEDSSTAARRVSRWRSLWVLSDVFWSGALDETPRRSAGGWWFKYRADDFGVAPGGFLVKAWGRSGRVGALSRSRGSSQAAMACTRGGPYGKVMWLHAFGRLKRA